MNNIKSIRALNFMNALNEDRSKVTTVEPIVAFRNILGMGEHLDTNTVIGHLSNVADGLGVLQEFQTKLVKPAYIGEVMTFDIGDPEETKESWCKFKVVREPLPDDPEEIAVNFVVSVEDKKAGKRYDRVIGAIARELQSSGEKRPIFRTISNLCVETEIEKEVSTENLKSLGEQEAQPEAKNEQEPEKPKANVVFPKDTEITFRPAEEDQTLAYLEAGETSYAMVSDEFPVMRDTKTKTYKAAIDITKEMLDAGFEVFGHLNFIKDEPWPKEDPAEKQLVIPRDEKYHIRRENDELQFWDLDSGSKIAAITDPEVPNMDENLLKKIFSAREDLMAKFLNEHPLSEILDKFEVEDDPDEVIIPKGQKTAFDDEKGVIYIALEDVTRAQLKDKEKRKGLFQTWEDPDEVLYKAGMMFGIDVAEGVTDLQGGTWKLIKDVTRGMLKDGKIPSEYWEEIKEEKKEEKNMAEDSVIYAKGEEVEDGNGKKFRAKQDIRRSNLTEDGSIPQDLLEEVKEGTTSVADIDAPAGDGNSEAGGEKKPQHHAVGDIPQKRFIKDDNTVANWNTELFGVPAPTILHLLKTLKAENANNQQVQYTGTWPVETLVVCPKYTYSIIRRKNGAFYRVYVSFTDMDAVNAGDASIFYLNSKDQKDKWFAIGDIKDPEISQIMNRRQMF